ncbi:hypothetical protein ASPSYDRAFT_85103 [Aspergillus sydowii CBS 593.65]|uniref:Nephrocystin 3-like N-terminal domain-containing protein n=1 Tax=Aspergillus sydowii CBS 593.65 TaxID=1036612 RepID=A0A1L9U0E0_9EURO|nr:uncharacterized protein ASPSYDRAFT_85103 [Aspergillus sydowii CBS 593.65]OJJ65125.1 hypothetical protein ASPSYDRAFT_85103 [Aspergillus sydowii CBS 593.65]
MAAVNVILPASASKENNHVRDQQSNPTMGMPPTNTAESIVARDNANVQVGNNYHTSYYGNSGLGELNPKLKRLRILQQLYQAPGTKVVCPTDYEGYKARNPKRVPGTCDWLLRSDQYLKWMQAPDSRCLWLTADAGSGKSVLASAAVDQLRRSEKDAVVCHFFFRDDGEIQRSGNPALRALLHQILMASETIPPTMASEYDSKGEAVFSGVEDLWRLLVSAVAEGGKDVFCILDGLDQCEGVSQRSLAKAISKLYERDATEDNTANPRRSPSLKMLITSRPLNSLTTKLYKLNHYRVRGEDQYQSIGSDIQLVITHEINELFEDGLIERHMRGLIHAKLSQQDDYTYLWIAAVMQELRNRAEDGASEVELLAVLDDNSFIYPVYANYLGQCTEDPSGHDSVLRKCFFQILLAAARPLTLVEMDYVLSIHAEHKHSSDILPYLHPARENFLRRLGGSLITFRGQVVNFIHWGVRDFLLAAPNYSVSSESRAASFGNWYLSIRMEEAHQILAQRCAWYLLLRDFRAVPTAIGHPPRDREAVYTKLAEQHPFLCYALKHWHQHGRMNSSGERNQGLVDLTSMLSCARYPGP